MNNNKSKKELLAYILDSKLITETFLKEYDIKFVDCGEFYQVYCYQNKKTITNKKDDTDLNLHKLKVKSFMDNEEQKETKTVLKDGNKIEDRNIIRSKLSCQRLAKANSKIWETFITLTIAENIQDIKKANAMLHSFTVQVRRIKKDFSYIAIPEFQKRGAVHYHLLTNISIDDTKLIYAQKDNPNFKHIKYWNKGFTSIEPLKDDIKKVVGYISKYMTKDIDDRLFGHRRYLYSQNLATPKESYINSDSEQDYNFFTKKIQDKKLIYENVYINPYDNSKVTFLEFQK